MGIYFKRSTKLVLKIFCVFILLSDVHWVHCVLLQCGLYCVDSILVASPIDTKRMFQSAWYIFYMLFLYIIHEIFDQINLKSWFLILMMILSLCMMVTLAPFRWMQFVGKNKSSPCSRYKAQKHFKVSNFLIKRQNT